MSWCESLKKFSTKIVSRCSPINLLGNKNGNLILEKNKLKNSFYIQKEYFKPWVTFKRNYNIEKKDEESIEDNEKEINHSNGRGISKTWIEQDTNKKHRIEEETIKLELEELESQLRLEEVEISKESDEMMNNFEKRRQRKIKRARKFFLFKKKIKLEIKKRLEKKGIPKRKPPSVGQLPSFLNNGFGIYFPHLLQKIPENDPRFHIIYPIFRAISKNGTLTCSEKEFMARKVIDYYLKPNRTKKKIEYLLEKYPDILSPQKYKLPTNRT
jgi:hypothetical protein